MNALPHYFLPHSFLLQLMANTQMEEIMLFIVVFMGSPKHVKSSHLRSKLAELLHCWRPQDEDVDGLRPMSARRCAGQPALPSPPRRSCPASLSPAAVPR